MKQKDFLVLPQFSPPLDPAFRPVVLANRKFVKGVEESRQAVPLVLSLERMEGAFSRFETVVYDEGHPNSEQNFFYVERLLKFLLWQRGGWRVFVGGPPSIGKYIQQQYCDSGSHDFDYHFMGRIYEKTFNVISCSASDVPAEHEPERSLGRHLDGNRIGFDLGASDLKVSAVINGNAIFSTEVEWQPGLQSDPLYHQQHIQAALELAASKLPSLDAIGGSSAGVFINNRPMIASLFRGIPDEKFSLVQNMFLEIRKKMNVPLEIINDGEVTALAGSMSLEDNGVLGIAMGSSEAAGYITMDGNITDWLNELAFSPIDFNPDAPIDEWSGDRGVGSSYFSQNCVFRLAQKVGIFVPQDMSNAKKLEFVQIKLENGYVGAEKIWQSMGIYLGYAIAHYADFYDIKHILILGRCTSGKGGPLMVEKAKEVLSGEFPELAEKINIQLPDEKSRRVGQSIAAASLPAIGG